MYAAGLRSFGGLSVLKQARSGEHFSKCGLKTFPGQALDRTCHRAIAPAKQSANAQSGRKKCDDDNLVRKRKNASVKARYGQNVPLLPHTVL